MKVTALEVHALRCIVQLSSGSNEYPRGINDIAAAEGLSNEYVAKIMRELRQAGLVISKRGSKGGYFLARPANTISVWNVIESLGGNIYCSQNCVSPAQKVEVCTRKSDCGIRAMWRFANMIICEVLSSVSIMDLLATEGNVESLLTKRLLVKRLPPTASHGIEQ